MQIPALVAARFLGMGPTELGIILLVVLVIFGPKNLPKLGSALGQTVKNVREGLEGKELEAGEAESDEDEEDEDESEEEAPATDKKSKKSSSKKD